MNSTSNNNSCYSNEEINKKLDGVYFTINFLDYEIDNYNITHPAHLVVKSEIYPITGYLAKSYVIFKKRVIYTTDYGFIFESNTDLEFYQHDSIFNSDYNLNTNSPVFASFQFHAKLENEIYKRSYVKIPSIIANVGGIMKACVTIFVFLNWIYNRKIVPLKLSNTLFSFNNLNEETFNKIKTEANFNKMKKEENTLLVIH